MEVSQVDDHITHAVVGQQEVSEMGVSDSAALMHILSTGLYTYPELATLREISCNGWDGHIISGRTQTPLQVTFSGSSVTIRDFGPGIAHAMIGKIYGTYGNSTKRDDATQTGGFGLGSKAPFAYVDNFEVVSRHEGVHTVYRVSKSSMALGGKPSINKIVDFPTEETGISVTFDIRPHDMGKFQMLLKEVAMLGEIPMLVDGNAEVLPMLPLSDSPTGYIITSVQGTIMSDINVRYGNVVYPVPRHEKYEEQWVFIKQALRKLDGHNQKIIFIAPGDSISIAPSRESLILSDLTVNTIFGLLLKFDNSGLVKGAETGRQIINQMTNKALESERPPLTVIDIFKTVEPHSMKLAGYVDARTYQSDDKIDYAYTVKRAQLHAILNQRGNHVNANKVNAARIKKLINNSSLDTKFVEGIHRVLRREAARNHRRKWYDLDPEEQYQKLVAQRVTLPIRMKMAEHEKLNMDRVFYTDTWSSDRTPELVEPKRYRIHGLHPVTGFLFKRVLLVRNKTMCAEFFQEMYRQYGHRSYMNTGWVVYMVPHNEKTQEVVRQAFKDLGYEIHERIPAKLEYQKPAFVGPPAPKKVAKKRKTLISLSQSYSDGRYLLNTGRDNNHKHPEKGVTDPIAYVQLNSKSEGATRFNYFSSEECWAITKLWGDQIAVVTGKQVDVMVAKGVPALKGYVYQHADKTLAAKQDFRRYLAFQQEDRVEGATEEQARLIKALTAHEKMMNELGLRFYVSAETALLISFFEGLSYGQDDRMPLCNALVDKVKPSPKYAETVKQLSSSPWKRYIKFDRLTGDLNSMTPDDPRIELPYEILRKLLNKEAKPCQGQLKSSRLP